MSEQSQGPGWWLASDGRWYPPHLAPGYGVTPATATTRRRADPLSTWLLIGGSAAVVIGALLPWASATAPFVGTIHKNGTSGDGVITLVLSGVAGAFGIAIGQRVRKRGLVIAALVLSALTLAVGVIDTADVSSRVADAPDVVSASVGVGLWITDIGAIVAVAGCILALVRWNR